MASKEELQRLVRAMNPDAEQIEEAAAAAPRVPGAVKALGRGFYEANIAPFLSPYETAMAIFGAGKQMVREPVETTKSMARSELERLQQAGQKPEAAAEYVGGMFSPFSMLRRAPTMREITAYQGSPAKFEPTPNNPLGEFDVSKAGSGVGQQNRGPGTYIAENPKVANRYRIARGSADPRKGFVYTVDLPDPMIEKMLDLDAPIVNQPKIRETLLKIADDNVLPRESADYLRYMLTSADRELQKYPLTGQGLVAAPREFGGIFRDSTEANTILQRYGIPGSKWKDDISRGPDKGTRNFVVFPGEEKKVKILEREGPKGERAFSVDPQTRTPEFKNWFKGSEVVDSQGQPLLVYHGTYNQFDRFRPGRAGAIYFTSDAKYAGDYGPNLMPSYLKVNKLADLTDPSSDAYKLAVKTFNDSGGWSSNEDTWANLLDEGRTNPLFDPKTDLTWEIFDLPEAEVDAALLKAGYDGVKLQERPGIDSYAVFGPEQIQAAVNPLAKRR